jgi:uncharacterized protein (DUF486 family)
MYTIALLIASNTFMTIAWYGHLKYKEKPLYLAILVSWMIALPEYALQVPANRIGHRAFSATQLKVMQEVISLSVFLVFAWLYFGEAPTWRTAVAFVLITIAVALVKADGTAAPASPSPAAPLTTTTPTPKFAPHDR